MAAILAIPVSSAWAVEDRTLSGPIETSGTLTLRITFEKKQGVRFRSYVWKATGVPVACKNGTRASVSFKGGMSIRNDAPGRRFFGETLIEKRYPGYRRDFEGELTSAGAAEGTLRIRGSAIKPNAGRCDSGTLEWSAVR